MSIKSIFIILFAVIFLGIIYLVVPKKTAEPSFSVIKKSGNFEIREYDPYLVAEVKVEGDRTSAIRSGFRILADYIFGNNKGKVEISMTAPVVQESGEKIAMTAPVMQSGVEGNWIVRFVMPEEYKEVSSLPLPNDDRVKLKEVGKKYFAVVIFSGKPSDKDLEKQQELLLTFIEDEGLNLIGNPVFAFYNPPWTFPMLRRNEVMIEVSL